MVTYIFSGLALVTSLASLGVSVLTYRMAGPKVTLASQSFTVVSSELWLRIKVVNVGKGEIDIDGATCDLLGPTRTTLPHRMKSASSHVVEFRAPVREELNRAGSVTVNIGLGNGRSLTSQVRLGGAEQASIRRALSSIQGSAIPPGPPPSDWAPPTQEEL